MKRVIFFAVANAVLAITAPQLKAADDSLPPLKDGKSPENLDEVWAGYDPTVEPLESKVLKTWEEDGAVIQAVRYKIGTFKGQAAWMGALYGFPKKGRDLPGLVQIHGGGGMGTKQPLRRQFFRRKTHQVDTGHRLSAHGVDVADRVRRGDLAVQIRIVDR